MRHETSLCGAATIALSLLLGACAGPSGLGGPAAGYVPSSIVAPYGYAQTRHTAEHYTVTATGSSATPPARLETIANARAAEIGIEEKQRFFKVASVTHGIRCVDKKESYKAIKTPANYYPTVALDVQYSNAAAAPDASWLPAKESFERLKSELAAPTLSEAPSEAELKSRCSARS